MTAPLLTLPISAPAASGGGQAAGGAAGAMGFEALMAAFFATGEGDVGLADEGEKTDESLDAEATATDGAPVAPVDAQTLAALLAVIPQAAPVAPQTTPAVGEGEQTKAGAPPAAFSPLLAQEIETAAPKQATAQHAIDATTPAAAEAAVEPALTETPNNAIAAPVADHTADDGVKAPTLTDQDKPQGATAPASDQAPNKPAASTQATTAQTAPPPTPPAQAQSATDPLAQAQAAAAEAQPAAEPVEEHTPAKPAKSESNRRNANVNAGPQSAPQTAPLTDPTAVAAVAPDAQGSSEQALSIGGESVAATTREAKPQTADAPDAQGPASTSAAVQNAAAPIVDAPLPPRGSPETVAHLAAQIVKKLEGRSTHFDVELNPAGLGQVTVSVEIGAQGKMTAALQFESAQAANELRGRAPELQKALEQAGFDLSGGGLSFDVAGDRGQGQGRGDLYQQQQQNDGGAWRGRAFQAVLDTADGAAEAAAAAALHLQRRPNAGVDVRV